MPIQFTLVAANGDRAITVFDPDADQPYVASDGHPNFNRIVEIALDESDSFADYDLDDLFDATVAVSKYLTPLSDRISTADGRVYLDGDEIDTSLSRQIVRFLQAGERDWAPLVAFYEKLLANPNDHSREQLYDWLDAHDFAITEQGDIIAYKGVKYNDDEGRNYSTHAGSAIVDGEIIEGYIPNEIGSVVEMPRSEVTFDPSLSCHSGLHVGTRKYARIFAHPTILEVHVNPRDVVSVPTGASGEKVRVCRYIVVAESKAEHTAPVVPKIDYGGVDETVCDECGNDLDEDGECADCDF